MTDRLKRWFRPRWELLFWVAVLGFVGYRLAPQLGAALGLGAGETPVTAGSFETIHGEVLSMEDFRGKVVLVNAWATWCPPCVVEMPGFQRVYEDYRDQGFMVLGISRDQGSPDLVRSFLRQKEITYPVAMAWQPGLTSFEASTLPTSFLVGRDGKIKHTVVGIFAEPTLRMAVKTLLSESLPGDSEAGSP